MSIGACQGIVLTNLIIPIILNPQEVEMNRNDTESSCVSTGGCCSVESVVSVDSRGQMVLPKDIREKANISAGDKLAVVGWEKDGEVCCISLVKVDRIGGMVRDLLGPMLTDLSEVKEETQ